MVERGDDRKTEEFDNFVSVHCTNYTARTERYK